VLPAAWAVPRILAQNGRLHLTSLDAKVTDVEEFAGARAKLTRDDRRTHDAIGGLAHGAFSVTRIDELYAVSPSAGWTAAHEFGHQVHNTAPESVRERTRVLLAQFRELGFVGDSYGLKNEQEFFACGYERFALRRAVSDQALDELHAADREHGLEHFFSELAKEAS
jgi:hypothetical protein